VSGERRALVTGATGFVGRHALRPLAEHGFEVHAVSRGEPPAELAHLAVWHRADLLEASAAEAAIGAARPTHLLHLAWYGEHGEYWGSLENVRWVEASLRLLRRFAGADGRRSVVAGTCAEYDWSRSPLSEADTPLRPATLYGAAKHGLHVVAAALAARAGFELAWGRIFFLYGPHEDPRRLVASVARALVGGERAPASHGRQLRDFLHVEDVAGAFAALLASDVTGAVNVASGSSVPIRDVVTLLGELSGRPELVELGALPAREGDPAELAADVRRLREEVGWQPARSLEEGLLDTLEWWRARV
jgi:nucleoside-diphosphate-sugar epimerase